MTLKAWKSCKDSSPVGLDVKERENRQKPCQVIRASKAGRGFWASLQDQRSHQRTSKKNSIHSDWGGQIWKGQAQGRGHLVTQACRRFVWRKLQKETIQTAGASEHETVRMKRRKGKLWPGRDQGCLSSWAAQHCPLQKHRVRSRGSGLHVRLKTSVRSWKKISVKKLDTWEET